MNRDTFRNSMRALTYFLAFLLVFSLAVILTGCNGNGIKRDSHDKTIDYRFEGERSTYTYQTVTDTKTGIVYLIWRSSDDSAVGGITPLLDKDGNVTYDEHYIGGENE